MVAVEAISFKQHTGFDALCAIQKIPCSLSPSPSAFLYSRLVSQCALDFKLFVCFHFTLNSVVLNLSIL